MKMGEDYVQRIRQEYGQAIAPLQAEGTRLQVSHSPQIIQRVPRSVLDYFY